MKLSTTFHDLNCPEIFCFTFTFRIAPSLLIIGTIFKIMHWPGAGVMLVLSLFMLGAIYLPVFVMVKIRDTRKAGKNVNMPMYIFGLIAGIIFIAGAMFKIQHWPGAGVMITLSGIVTVFVFIPVLVIQAIKDKENQVQNFTILIFVLSFVAITFMMYALRVSKNVLTSFVISTIDHMNTSEMVGSRNASYLEQAALLVPDNEGKLEQAKAISDRTDMLSDYIQKVMEEIILNSHENNFTAVDENGNIDLKNVSDYDVVYSTEMVIFGDEIMPGKGEELKKRIDEHREFLAASADPELASMIKKILDTSPMGEPETPWLEVYFLGAPMIGAVNILTNMQANLRFLEGEVLRQLI